MTDEASAPPEAIPPPSPKLWRVVLAGLSFVLGLASCFMCWYGVFSGIPAVLLGFIARRGLPRKGGRVPGAGMAKVGIVLGSIGVSITVALILIVFAVNNAQRAPNKAICQNNLKQIGICLKMYAGEHDGALPDKLSALYPKFATDPYIFVCPSTGKEHGDPACIDEWCEYTLVPGLRETGTIADVDVLLCFDSEYRHTPPGRNELYLDGHVELRRLGRPPRSALAKHQ